MKTWVLNHKKISTFIVFALLSTWFLGHFMPNQNCLATIKLYTSDTYMIGTNNDDLFKTRNDALDYCMAQRWYF